jgi:hypothetical protein
MPDGCRGICAHLRPGVLVYPNAVGVRSYEVVPVLAGKPGRGPSGLPAEDGLITVIGGLI